MLARLGDRLRDFRMIQSEWVDVKVVWVCKRWAVFLPEIIGELYTALVSGRLKTRFVGKDMSTDLK